MKFCVRLIGEKGRLILIAVVCAMLVPSAFAGQQTCNGKVVGNGVRRCPDGSIPVYQAETLTPDQPSNSGQDNAKPTKSQPRKGHGSAGSLIGVWHTSVSGAVYQTPSQIPGYDKLTISPGIAAGDLTISPNRYYTWNSYGGKFGRWQEGKDGAIVLIDTVEKRKWIVEFDEKHTGGRDIIVWDGNAIWYNGHR